MDTRAALRYAQALLDLGEERKNLDRLREDVTSIEESLHASSELRAMLTSPVIRPAVKYKVLNELFSKRLSPELMLFIDLLVKKGRGELLGATASEFRKLLDKRSGTVEAQIRSAIELGKEERAQIQSKLEAIIGKKVRPSFSIDPSVRGGFVARVGDTQIDASLQHQLELLREQFKRGGAVVLN